ncbi:MAG TPA: aminotransferase DegT [Lentisphaeria bacterium]|nr:MAG: aminotransferase DegT [Lentisphaerae bacterium GWF2_50_93]HCE42144.1 aminotransferase DegT [Lentisphaeria bacterium]
MKTIPLFKPSFHVDECLSEIRECLEKGWTGLGYKTLIMEEKWKEYTGLPYAHFLNSATAGLHLAVKILKDRHGWKDGDEVISTPFTFVSTNHAITYAGLKPVFADIDGTLNLNPGSVVSRITPRTRAIMFVGIGGNAANFPEVREIGRKHGLKVILDAAHMAGTRIDGVHAGHGADVTVFSFHAVKNLPTADSGMLCFSDEESDRMARRLSWLGIDLDTYSRSLKDDAYKWKYDVPCVGFKYHGNSVMASLALVGLKYLDEDNGYRRRIAGWYAGALDEGPELSVVRHEGCESSRHLFQILLENREAAIIKLNRHGINPGVHYRDNREYPQYQEALDKCPECVRLSGKVLSLPVHLGMTEDDVERIADVLKENG